MLRDLGMQDGEVEVVQKGPGSCKLVNLVGPNTFPS